MSGYTLHYQTSTGAHRAVDVPHEAGLDMLRYMIAIAGGTILGHTDRETGESTDFRKPAEI